MHLQGYPVAHVKRQRERRIHAQALPLYIRDKVAQTNEERAAERARKEMLRGATAGKPT